LISLKRGKGTFKKPEFNFLEIEEIMEINELIKKKSKWKRKFYERHRESGIVSNKCQEISESDWELRSMRIAEIPPQPILEPPT